MFKPLLRTLPSLSGNFALACPVNYITRNSIDDFTVNIRTAKMIPLQNYVSAPKVNDIDLLNNKYEYDVFKYYKNLSLSSHFYESRREVDTSIFNKFNLTTNNDYSSSLYGSRDTDYEFGVKRISHSQYGYQFMFYAPIYIDDVNNIPESFQITLSYSDIFKNTESEKVNKTININIGKRTIINYLRTYLNTYLKKIDKSVVSINHYYKNATYYGIDIEKGGLQEYQYSIISNVFNKYMNIMDFDEIVCNGFQGTKQIMRQIIPLAFLFNIDDFLTENERRYLYGKSFKISGAYISDRYVHKFFDFAIDYRELYVYNQKFNITNGEIEYTQTKNILDMNDGFHEAYLKDLFTKNKATPYITKWKFLQSTDDDAYIENLNYSFSANSGYGKFPAIIHNSVFLKIVQKDLILPNTQSNIATYKESNSIQYLNNLSQYINNFNTSWYNIISNDTIDISTVFNNDYWSNVINNKSYFKGILYNILNIVYEYNTKCILNNVPTIDVTDVDKFGVFLTIDKDTKVLNKDYIYVKYVLNKGTEYLTNPKAFQDVYAYEQHKLFHWTRAVVKDKNGKDTKKSYIKFKQHVNYSNIPLLENRNYSNGTTSIQTNCYFTRDKNGNYVNYKSFARSNRYVILKNDEEWTGFWGYVKIDYNVTEIKPELFDHYDFYYTNPNSTVYNSLTANTSIPLTCTGVFYKVQLASLMDIYNQYVQSQYEKYGEDAKKHTKKFKDYVKAEFSNRELYEFVPKTDDGSTILLNYFKKKTYAKNSRYSQIELKDDKFKDFIYIDSYNLKNFIEMHNRQVKLNKLGNEYLVDENILDITPHRTAYVRLDNEQMVREYKKEGAIILTIKKSLTIDTDTNTITHHHELAKDTENVLYYAKKNVYLFTNELRKLFKNVIDTSFKQLYLLELESEMDACCMHELKPNVDATNEISIDCPSYKHFIDGNLYINSEKRKEFANIFSNNNNFQAHNIYITKHNIRFDIYKRKMYDFDMFVNIDLLTDSIKNAIINRQYERTYIDASKTSQVKHRYVNVQRYSLYHIEPIKSYDIDIFEHDNKKYLYLLINLYCENNSLSFNILNNNLITFNSVNGAKLSNESFKNILKKYHHYFIPALKTNLFSNYLNNFSKYIEMPSTISYMNTSKATPLIGKENNTYIRYKTTYNNRSSKISLNRYLGDCTPLILETTIVNNSYEKVMIREDNMTIKTKISTSSNNTDNAFRITTLYTSGANDIYVYDPFDVDKELKKMKYFEYKHFNDNNMFNLEPSFEIVLDRLVTESELNNNKVANTTRQNIGNEWEYYNDTIEYALFNNYIKKHYIGNDEKKFANNIRYETHILFLFNKYDVTRTTTQISVNPLTGEHMYAVKYKYELI